MWGTSKEACCSRQGSSHDQSIDIVPVITAKAGHLGGLKKKTKRIVDPKPYFPRSGLVAHS